jgi:hypothetical protein
MRLYHLLAFTAVALMPILSAACGGSEDKPPVQAPPVSPSAAQSQAQALENSIDRFAKAMATGDMIAAYPLFSPAGMQKAMQLQGQASGAYPTAATPANAAVRRAGGPDEAPMYDVVLDMSTTQVTMRTTWRLIGDVWKVDDIAMQSPSGT